MESIVNRQATVMDDAVQLRDKPFILTAGIVFGALVGGVCKAPRGLQEMEHGWKSSTVCNVHTVLSRS